MTTQLTKQQLESITPKMIATMRKLKAILANMDIRENDTQYIDLLRQGMAARECGLSYKRIEAIYDERKVL